VAEVEEKQKNYDCAFLMTGRSITFSGHVYYINF